MGPLANPSYIFSDIPAVTPWPGNTHGVTPNPFHLPAYRYELVEVPRYWIGDNAPMASGSRQSMAQADQAQSPFQLPTYPLAPQASRSPTESQVDELAGAIEQLQLQWQQRKSQGRFIVAEVPPVSKKPAGPMLRTEKR